MIYFQFGNLRGLRVPLGIVEGSGLVWVVSLPIWESKGLDVARQIERPNLTILVSGRGGGG